jgi:hypothetical protein
MVRSLLTPQTTDLHICIPPDYIGKKVEVLVFTYDEAIEKTAKSKTGIMEKFWGIISDETAEEMHKHVNQSRDEWERDI